MPICKKITIPLAFNAEQGHEYAEAIADIAIEDDRTKRLNMATSLVSMIECDLRENKEALGAKSSNA